jgi:hypothetical protein
MFGASAIATVREVVGQRQPFGISNGRFWKDGTAVSGRYGAVASVESRRSVALLLALPVGVCR